MALLGYFVTFGCFGSPEFKVTRKLESFFFVVVVDVVYFKAYFKK